MFCGKSAMRMFALQLTVGYLPSGDNTERGQIGDEEGARLTCEDTSRRRTDDVGTVVVWEASEEMWKVVSDEVEGRRVMRCVAVLESLGTWIHSRHQASCALADDDGENKHCRFACCEHWDSNSLSWVVLDGVPA